jgi:hypothetical protein
MDGVIVAVEAVKVIDFLWAAAMVAVGGKHVICVMVPVLE